MMKKIVLFFCLLVATTAMYAQQVAPSFGAPLGVELLLSANFGELRPDHFHSGLDFKTQGRTGLKVYAADEGYVSRIAISPWGYGKALYINHPSGYTTVYAHLDAFVGAIADTLLQLQYEKESFAIDTILSPGVLPVTKGMYIAKSGNSGSSGGPHLHFEIRHTASESPIDPLPWYRHLINDNVAPNPRLVTVYHHDKAVAGNPIPKSALQLQSVSSNTYNATADVEAWGRVSLGIKAYDKMTGTTNIYGVHSVRCWVDDSLIYSSTIDSITFAETRYINSLIDYHELRSNKGSTIMRTALLPGNKLSTIYDTLPTEGMWVIDQERMYHCMYELTDLYGNTSRVKFNIKGVPTETATTTSTSDDVIYFDYNHDNEYATEQMNIYIPAGALYDNLNFMYKMKESVEGYSSLHRIHNRTVPLHKWCEVAIKLTCDTLPDEKYYLQYSYDDKKSPIIGRYEAGWYVARVRSLGNYKVMADVDAPKIVARKPENWVANGKISFNITDKGSGIATYRGEIDGNYCLFEYDAKTNRLSCNMKDYPFKKGVTYTLSLVVTDHCGNSNRVKHTIKL